MALGSVGAGVLVGLPLLAVLLMASVLGLPLGLTLLLALAFVLSVGFALSAWVVGRLLWSPPRSRWLALLFGWLVASVATAVPTAGTVVWFLAAGFGLGAAAVAAWRAGAPPGATAPGTRGRPHHRPPRPRWVPRRSRRR